MAATPSPSQEKPSGGKTKTERPSWGLSDVFSNKWLPKAPPKLMAAIEGWGYDSLPDLGGRTFLVTGGSSGIGLEASRHLAQAGANVYIASPSKNRAEDAMGEILCSTPDLRGRLQWMQLDLASIASIRSFTDKFLAKNEPLHGLLLNAAVQLRAEEKTEDGMEQNYGTNFVGHFLLTHHLLRRLQESTPSRIVWMTSLEEQYGQIPWDDPLSLRASPTADLYSTSKLANLMVGLEMARRLKGSGVDVFVTHPGIAQTEIGARFERRLSGAVMRQAMQAAFGQSAYRGALPLVYAAAEPALEGHGGRYVGPPYWGNLALQMISLTTIQPLNKEARSPHARFRLYEQTADALESLLRSPLPNRLKGVASEGMTTAPPLPAKGARVSVERAKKLAEE